METEFSLTYDQIRWLDEAVEGEWKIEDDDTITVDGDLNCSGTGIDEIPVVIQKVTGKVDISDNDFTNLDSLPFEIEGDLDCRDNNLNDDDLEGIEVGGEILFLSEGGEEAYNKRHQLSDRGRGGYKPGISHG